MIPSASVEQFIRKWQHTHEPERAVSQSHFIEEKWSFGR